MPTIKLDHPTDPRYLRLAAAPPIVSPEALFRGDYGKPLLMADEPDLVYPQPDGPGTDWIHPDIVEDVRLRRENVRLRRELSKRRTCPVHTGTPEPCPECGSKIAAGL